MSLLASIPPRLDRADLPLEMQNSARLCTYYNRFFEKAVEHFQRRLKDWGVLAEFKAKYDQNTWNRCVEAIKAGIRDKAHASVLTHRSRLLEQRDRVERQRRGIEEMKECEINAAFARLLIFPPANLEPGFHPTNLDGNCSPNHVGAFRIFSEMRDAYNALECPQFDQDFQLNVWHISIEAYATDEANFLGHRLFVCNPYTSQYMWHDSEDYSTNSSDDARVQGVGTPVYPIIWTLLSMFLVNEPAIQPYDVYTDDKVLAMLLSYEMKNLGIKRSGLPGHFDMRTNDSNDICNGSHTLFEIMLSPQWMDDISGLLFRRLHQREAAHLIGTVA